MPYLYPTLDDCKNVAAQVHWATMIVAANPGFRILPAFANVSGWACTCGTKGSFGSVSVWRDVHGRLGTQKLGCAAQLLATTRHRLADLEFLTLWLHDTASLQTATFQILDFLVEIQAIGQF